jgi:biopolymer transport protein ExbD
MAAVGSPESGGGKKKGKKKRSKRHGFSLDMTPMVDVAFLLLTFFMLTTTFSKPKTMEINLPADKNDNEVKVAESNVLTLRIMEGDKAYWNIGFQEAKPIELYDKGGDKPAISNAFRKVLSENRDRIKAEVQGQDVMVLVLKLDKKAKYKNIVDVIDELNVMAPPLKRFSIADFTDADKLEIEKVAGGAAQTQPTGGKK